MKKNQGFTLIELLVVIAIIGILASVVLASLNSARTKGQDAAIQAQLASMRSQAELFYSTTGANTYGTASTTDDCTTGSLFLSGTNTLSTLLAGINTTKACFSSGSAWAVAATGATSGTYYCADSTGASKVYTASSSPAATALTGASGTGAKAASAAVCN